MRQPLLSALLAINLSTAPAWAQDPPLAAPAARATADPHLSVGQAPAPAALVLEDGTPVKLRIARTISSADAQVDERVDFEVLEEIKVGETVVIPRGSVALATVTEAQPKRRMGRGGKLNVNIDSVRLASGEKAALRAVKEVKGGGHAGKMTGAIVATSIVFFPAAPLFLFMKGKDITIPKGTEITAYVNGDITLDLAKFGVRAAIASAVTATSPAPEAAADELSSVTIKSTPEGAEITIDGKFVGSTPSTVKLQPGDRAISVTKPGHKPWQRHLSVGRGGSLTLEPGLEKADAAPAQQ